MAKAPFDARMGVWFAPTVADISAPTTTEIGNGTDLTAFTSKAGVTFGVDNQTIDIGDLSTTFNAEIMGNHGASLSLELFRDDATDTAWDTLPQGTNGYIIVQPFSQTAAVGESAMVFQVETGEREPNASAANEAQKFTSESAVQAIDLDATVA